MTFNEKLCEELRRRNTARLREIVAEHGWPGTGLAGMDGAEAAWFIAQPAVLDLDFQREALKRLTAAAEAGDAPAWQMAMLTDRVRMGSGEPQVYGCALFHVPPLNKH